MKNLIGWKNFLNEGHQSESNLSDFLAELDDICQELIDEGFLIEYETIYSTNKNPNVQHKFKGEDNLSRILMYITKGGLYSQEKFWLTEVKEYVERTQEYLKQSGYPSSVYLDSVKYTIDFDDIIEVEKNSNKKKKPYTLLKFKTRDENYITNDEGVDRDMDRLIKINSFIDKVVIDIRLSKEKGVRME